MMTDIDNDGEWKPCFEVSGIRLPTSYHIGLSAATGDLAGLSAMPLYPRVPSHWRFRFIRNRFKNEDEGW